MKYNPEKHYQWAPDAQFTITGKELGLISYTIKSILSTEEAAKILLAERVNDVVEKLIALGVESGIATEVKQSKTDENETKTNA